jgi:D-alanyl-D-alanine carboxypeptidase
MTFAFGSFTLGAALLFSAFKNQSLVSLILGQKGEGISEQGESHPSANVSEEPNTADSLVNNAAGAAAGAITKAPKNVPHTPAEASKLSGLSVYDGHQVARWIVPFLAYARQHGWKGHVESGYRSEAEQRRIYNSGVRPAAVPGTSNHEGKAFPRGAVDVTEASQLSMILKAMPGGSLLKWAESADPVHFSYPHDGGY